MMGYMSGKTWREGTSERRRLARYYFLDNDVRVFRHINNKFGWITDISGSGLSFEYIPVEELDNRREIVDIFNYSDDRIFLPGISCKKIYEIHVSQKSHIQSPVYFLRCGFKCDFTERQAYKLEELISSLETMPIS